MYRLIEHHIETKKDINMAIIKFGYPFIPIELTCNGGCSCRIEEDYCFLKTSIADYDFIHSIINSYNLRLCMHCVDFYHMVIYRMHIHQYCVWIFFYRIAPDIARHTGRLLNWYLPKILYS